MRGVRMALWCALAGACGEAAPLELPAARAEAVAVVDDRVVVLLVDRERRGWLASVDEVGAARWVTQVGAPLPPHAPEVTRIEVAGEDGVLGLVDLPNSREARLGFSALDGAPRWQSAASLDAAVPEIRWLGEGQSIALYGGQNDDTWRVEASSLRTGEPQFVRSWPRVPGVAPLRFAEHVAVREAGIGWSLYRRGDGLLRARLPIDGGACRLGESIVGFHDGDLLAIEVARPEAPPRVLAAVLNEHEDGLVSCHRRGDGVVLQLYRRHVRLLALAGDGAQVWSGEHESNDALPLAPELGDVMPRIHWPDVPHSIEAVFETPPRRQTRSEPSLSLFEMASSSSRPTELRRMEPAIHRVLYRTIEPFAGGYLAWSWADDGPIDLISIDAMDGEVTGAARVLGRIEPISPQNLAGGRLWLIGALDGDGPLRLRTLDPRTLQPLAPGELEIVDRTDEARAAWLAPPDPGPEAEDYVLGAAFKGAEWALDRVKQGPARAPWIPCTSRPNAPFLTPPWDLDELRLQAVLWAPELDPAAIELLAWDSNDVVRDGPSRGEQGERDERESLHDPGREAYALLVAEDVDAKGPRWWLIPMRRDDERWRVTQDDLGPLRRRPSRRDVERAVAATGAAASFMLAGRGGPYPDIADLDRRRFLALTGEAPWPGRCAAP